MIGINKYVLEVVWAIAMLFVGWTIRGWHEDSVQLDRTNESIITGWRLQSDLNGVMATLSTEKAAAMAIHQQLDKDIANYVKSPTRTTKHFDAERVRIKAEAARAANSVTRPKI